MANSCGSCSGHSAEHSHGLGKFDLKEALVPIIIAAVLFLVDLIFYQLPHDAFRDR